MLSMAATEITLENCAEYDAGEYVVVVSLVPLLPAAADDDDAMLRRRTGSHAAMVGLGALGQAPACVDDLARRG